MAPQLAPASELFALVVLTLILIILKLTVQPLQLLLSVGGCRGKARATEVLLEVVFGLTIPAHHAGDLFGELK